MDGQEYFAEQAYIAAEREEGINELRRASVMTPEEYKARREKDSPSCAVVTVTLEYVVLDGDVPRAIELLKKDYSPREGRTESIGNHVMCITMTPEVMMRDCEGIPA